MSQYRKYGAAPFSVAVLHGGPGAPGSAAGLAQGLGKRFGVLEPYQSKYSVSGQVEELRDFLLDKARLPASIVGWSWGAWLGYLLAAEYPELVKQLVLVCSGPFEESYAQSILKTRLERLENAERREVEDIQATMSLPGSGNQDALLARFGKLLSKADSFDPLPDTEEEIRVQADLHTSIWSEARELRADGSLLALGNRIRCPVAAIHGKDDPHPYQGVKEPLEGVLGDFTFILLARCGHAPWKERQAKEQFFLELEKILT